MFFSREYLQRVVSGSGLDLDYILQAALWVIKYNRALQILPLDTVGFTGSVGPFFVIKFSDFHLHGLVNILVVFKKQHKSENYS